MLKLTTYNPFRLLSLPATMELKELKKQLSAARKKLKVGLPLTSSLASLFPDVDPTKAFDEIERTLDDPHKRTAFRCLWSSQSGIIAETDDFEDASDSEDLGNADFLGSWYNFESEKSPFFLEPCLTHSLVFSEHSALQGALAGLLVREEGLPIARAREIVEQAVESALDELSCHVVDIARRNQHPELLETLLDDPLLTPSAGTWLEHIIRYGNQLSEGLSKQESTVAISETENLLETLLQAVSPYSTRAELWSGALKAHRAGREAAQSAQRLKEDLGSIPGDDNEQVVLREIIRLSTLRRFSDDPKVHEGWSDAVDLLVRVRTDLLRQWLDILKSRVKGFSQENPGLIELLQSHLEASEEGQSILNKEACSRAVKFATAVCLEMAHTTGSPSAEERQNLAKAFDLVSSAERRSVQSDLQRLKGRYPAFFRTHANFWEEAARLAGSAATSSQATRWATETIVDAAQGAAKQKSEDGCGSCLGMIFVGGLFFWMATLGPCGGPSQQRDSSATQTVESNASTSLREKHSELVNELERQDRNLRLEKIGIEADQSYLQTESRQIEEARFWADSDEQSLAEFNDRVTTYNSALETCAAREAAYNKAVDERNALFTEIRALESTGGGR